MPESLTATILVSDELKQSLMNLGWRPPVSFNREQAIQMCRIRAKDGGKSHWSDDADMWNNLALLLEDPCA